MIEHLDFIMWLTIFCGFLVFILAIPEMYRDTKDAIEHIRKQLKRPAAGTADQEKTSNYNISEFRNIHNLERWR